jgi:hypothetical protein
MDAEQKRGEEENENDFLIPGPEPCELPQIPVAILILPLRLRTVEFKDTSAILCYGIGCHSIIMDNPMVRRKVQTECIPTDWSSKEEVETCAKRMAGLKLQYGIYTYETNHIDWTSVGELAIDYVEGEPTLVVRC